jgi:hypothetical protein
MVSFPWRRSLAACALAQLACAPAGVSGGDGAALDGIVLVGGLEGSVVLGTGSSGVVVSGVGSGAGSTVGGPDRGAAASDHPCATGDDVSVRNGVHLGLARGDFAPVAACLTHYTRRFPRAAVAWYNLGYARAQLGDTTAALEALEVAVAVEPGNGVFMEQVW